MFSFKKTSKISKVTVIGAGAFGTALAKVLSDSKLQVMIWSHSKDTVSMINDQHENLKYLPDVALPSSIVSTHHFDQAFDNTEIIFFSVPTQVTREVLNEAKVYLDKKIPIVICSKGIERGTHKLLSEIFIEVLGNSIKRNLFFLSGPSFAYEIARNMPTGLTLAGYDTKILKELQQKISNPYFRLYTTTDVIGVQLAGALKNVIALACGVSDGLKLGHSARSALMTRGLSEMIRLGDKMGADSKTFMGLSGIGDLALTCGGNLSRNRRVGINLGKGMKIKDIMNSLHEVAEGVYTVDSAYWLSKKYDVDMPIVEYTYKIIYKNQSAKGALKKLMNRPLKAEYL